MLKRTPNVAQVRIAGMVDGIEDPLRAVRLVEQDCLTLAGHVGEVVRAAPATA